MNEILEHYKLFGVIFLTILLMVVIIYKFLFKIEKREDKVERLEHKWDGTLSSIEHDEKVFQQFNKLLPPAAGSIYFLRNNNMTMVFHKRGLDGIYAFYEGCKNDEYTFIDEELEELKTDFYLSVEQYLLTFELNSKETSSGYYRVDYNIDGLHMLVDELLNKYDKLSSTSQKKLLTT
jgi:hypothetical protein